jgi:microcystin-dependent protein
LRQRAGYRRGRLAEGDGMVELYLGQIIQGGWSFAPSGTAQCAGQTLSIAQYSALFALLGTNFGGNGQTTFQLPDLQGRVAIGTGTGAGLPPYVIGERAGNVNAQLTIANMPAHNHAFTGSPGTLQVSTNKATTQAAAAGDLLGRSDDTSTKGSTPAIYIPAASSTGTVNLGGVNAAGTVGMTGGSLPFSILNPYLAITFVIALVGIFPSRN